MGWFLDRFSLTHREAGRCLWDSFVPEQMRNDPELLRRSRLQIRFGWLGAIFGSAYAIFYLLIGHWWGAEIVVLCSLVFACIPGLLKRSGNLHLIGHIFGLILLTGFSGLCAVEGGLHGHAIAWLASVPLCVLLLLELRGALIWSGLCLMVAITFGVLEVYGRTFPKTYPMAWDSWLNFAGYCGLVPFMALLGVVFERTRARAFQQLESAMAELSVANQRLRKVNEDKSEFLKIAAHDLKNPLGAISGYAELLTLTGMPSMEQIVEATTTIRGQSKRMLGIISNLLDVQRIEEGSMKLKLIKCSIERVAREMVKTYVRRAEQKQMQVNLVCDASVPSVLADESAVEQILDNLVSNAIKYSPHGSTVNCVLVTDEHFVHVEIRDQGPGLSAADQQNLFKKFSRLTPRPTGGESSNGLGLWIVQRMAQAMGGDVFCRSILGEGSTFGLSLPRWVHEGSTEATPAANAAASPASALFPGRLVSY